MNKLMPAYFIGHGSPMNAIQNNQITKSWQEIVKNTPQPKAILVISAHWYIPELVISSQLKNLTIHDFFGFPEKLAQYEYPSSGSPELATEICELLRPEFDIKARKDMWGLDHGVWSILTHVYPETSIPILQISIDNTKPPQWHYDLGQKLNKLRENDVLIIGSGNIVHNLSKLNWHQPNMGEDWAIEFDNLVVKLIKERNFSRLCDYLTLSAAVKLSVPTPEHYLPLLYILGLANEIEELAIFNQTYEYGSLSMTSVRVG